MNCKFLIRTLVPALFVAPLASAAVEEADFSLETTEDLYTLCSVATDSDHYVPSIYACRGFLEGAVQYHDAVTDRKNLKRLVCYPQGTTLEDGRQVFLKWVTVHRGDKTLMGEMPVVGLVRALADGYPCKG